MAVEDGKVPAGSLTQDAGNISLARGAAGSEGGAHGDLSEQDVSDARDVQRDVNLEERRETQQVQRPSTDGIGEGMTKDAS